MTIGKVPPADLGLLLSSWLFLKKDGCCLGRVEEGWILLETFASFFVFEFAAALWEVDIGSKGVTNPPKKGLESSLAVCSSGLVGRVVVGCWGVAEG